MIPTFLSTIYQKEVEQRKGICMYTGINYIFVTVEVKYVCYKKNQFFYRRPLDYAKNVFIKKQS